jgi:arylsulfatase A-like enzyme
MKLTRTGWAAVLAGAVLGLSSGAWAAAKPNIIFILADDLGWTDLGVQGSKYYETPNLDRLAAQGQRFTCYHNSQNCQPSRAALMTGQYGPRTGVYTVGGIDRFNWQSRPLRPVDNVTKLPLEKVIIPQALKSAGYATAMFGKWHLGDEGEYHPSKRGFDEAIVSMGAHFDFKTNPKTDYPKGQYLADFLTNHALDFIKRHKDGPFFLYLPHFAVHSPHQAKENLIERFKPKAPVGGHHSPVYAGMIASVDESVGRVMALLDELKIADNTVVIFSSDNGGVGGYDRPDGLIRDNAAGKGGGRFKDKDDGEGAGGITDNAPLRSGKGSLYEGGTREPFIVRWPGVTKPGATCPVPSIHVDLYPTLLEIAGAKPPAQILDGESLVPLLRDSSAALKRDAIYQHVPGYLGAGPGLWRTTPVATIICGDWKLMEYFEDGHLELYNLKDDIGETKNLAQSMPEKAQELRKKMLAWRAAINAPMPTPNTPQAAEKKGKGQGKGKGKKNKQAGGNE